MKFFFFAILLLGSANGHAAHLTVRGDIRTYRNEGSLCNFDLKFISSWSVPCGDGNGKMHECGWLFFEPAFFAGTIFPGNGFDVSSARTTALEFHVSGCEIIKSEGRITGRPTDRLLVWLEGENCKPIIDAYTIDGATSNVWVVWTQVPTMDGSLTFDSVAVSLHSPTKVCQ